MRIFFTYAVLGLRIYLILYHRNVVSFMIIYLSYLVRIKKTIYNNIELNNKWSYNCVNAWFFFVCAKSSIFFLFKTFQSKFKCARNEQNKQHLKQKQKNETKNCFIFGAFYSQTNTLIQRPPKQLVDFMQGEWQLAALRYSTCVFFRYTFSYCSRFALSQCRRLSFVHMIPIFALLGFLFAIIHRREQKKYVPASYIQIEYCNNFFFTHKYSRAIVICVNTQR